VTDPIVQAGWFADVSDVFALIEGIYRVYGVKGEEGDPKVVPMASELPTGAIVGVLGYDGGTITPGSWERQTHSLNAAIWVPATADTIDRAYTLAIAYVDRVLEIFPGHGKAGATPANNIASCLVTAFDQVESRAWGNRDAQLEYVVLPFSIEVVRNRAAAYVAA
jgi:hypothetical protein